MRLGVHNCEYLILYLNKNKSRKAYEVFVVFTKGSR